MALPRDLPSPTPRQRWIAAQRLAAGEAVEGAAAYADLPSEAVDLLQLDPRFNRQVEAERAKLARTDEEWLNQVRIELRQATERALADERVSTVNTLLRACLVLPALAVATTSAEAAADTLGADEPLPPLDPDAAREARRQALLARVRPALRPSLAKTSLELLEQFTAVTDPDPTVYEAWFAAQTKPPTTPLALAAEDQALIRHVTRHNPPWLKGAYLGYYRPPVPSTAFAPEPEAPAAPAAAPPPMATPPSGEVPAEPETLPGLRARVARLLDRAVPRRLEELDLAEAICALRWPNWPAYQGPIDLGLLRQALHATPLDPDTLHWLGSTRLAQACREADHAPIMAQGP